MAKDEIKKALMKCSVDSCKDCPYDNKGLYCCGKLKRDALELINEQEREIERLKDDCSKLQEQFAQYQMASDKEIRAQRKQAQIDVLNRLKVFSEPYPNSWGIYVIDVYHIDELIKEIENEQGAPKPELKEF